MSKKPDGRPGHKGTSRIHNPERTVHYRFKSKKRCCGKPMIMGEKKRDIIQLEIKTH